VWSLKFDLLRITALSLLPGDVVFLSVFYVSIQRILRLVLLLFRSTEFKEVEIVILRHIKRRESLPR